MIEDVAQVVDVLLKALGDIVFRVDAVPLLKERVVLLIRLQVCRFAGDRRGQAHGRVVQSQQLQRLGEGGFLCLRLHVRGISFDEADGLIPMRHKEAVDAVVQFPVKAAVCLHRAVHRRAVGALAVVQLLQCPQIGLVILQVLIFLIRRINAELLGGVRCRRAVPHVFHSACVLLVKSGYPLFGCPVFHKLLYQLTLLAVQRPFLALAVLKGAHPVKHGVHPVDLPPVVFRHRIEQRFIDLLAVLCPPFCGADTGRGL